MKFILKYFDVTLLQWPWFVNYNCMTEFKKTPNKR